MFDLEWHWSETADPPCIQLTKIVPWSSASNEISELLESDSKDEKSLIGEKDFEEADENIHRDQSFLANLDYLLSTDSGASRGQLQEDDDNECAHLTPKGFLAFIRDESRFFVKKASLVWMLSIGSNRVSTDRIYRFISDKKTPDGSNLMLGDFVHINLENVEQLVQIISFRFCNGKKFFGDYYTFQDSNSKTKDVEMLTNFFRIQNNIVTWDGRAQRWINVKNFSQHAVLKRDLSGNLIFL